ncbi:MULTISPECIES: VRR-NUC domain-containing protein [Eisenbergiella]|uniref:VRR-NUC domain-containing protein n=1 Tax=Eisenbergiella TaxID=1432051 RepID=UPI0023EF78FA|nr:MULTISPECIES: VRR-NUC domain-containing protein [Eisenbergiella]MCI6707432.1 VRR-NUC domain-containing protein [Eisenbergiella massiliensis]MDY5529082.1 VRR-NUC domain-containing protein [Eisenbergiella porci]
MREKDIEKVLVNEVRKQGGRAYKWVSPGNDGVPDRIVILPGRPPVFVELKTETGKLSALQEVQITRLRELGQDVRVLRGMQEVRDFLKECEAVQNDKNGMCLVR